MKLAFVTLHVGLGTFRPVKEEEITDHIMHSEYYVMDEETAKVINETGKHAKTFRELQVQSEHCRHR